jgi:hypothetical protein
MAKKIIAIGGAVIKTSRKLLKRVIHDGHVDMLIHNGGSIFHDFQLSIDTNLTSPQRHSYKLDALIDNPKLNEEASYDVWDWLLNSRKAPPDSVTGMCEARDIPVLMFTIPGADFWHLFGGGEKWSMLGAHAYIHFAILRDRFKKPFHYVCMGSAVVHPEIFTKAIAGIKLPEFQADVVDFKDMYRPSTRVAKYGNYYCMNHKEYLKNLLKNRV